MISYKILKEFHISKVSLKLFRKYFNIKKEYTIEEVLKILKDYNTEIDYKDVNRLIQRCPYCQTEEMLDYFKSLYPVYYDVSELIMDCKYCQTEEMLEYYKSLNPVYSNVSSLIKNCKYYQTKEMLDYYKSLDPDYKDVKWLIFNCKYCQTKKMIKYYKSLNPDYDNVSELISQCTYCQSKKIRKFLLEGEGVIKIKEQKTTELFDKLWTADVIPGQGSGTPFLTIIGILNGDKAISLKHILNCTNSFESKVTTKMCKKEDNLKEEYIKYALQATARDVNDAFLKGKLSKTRKVVTTGICECIETTYTWTQELTLKSLNTLFKSVNPKTFEETPVLFAGYEKMSEIKHLFKETIKENVLIADLSVYAIPTKYGEIKVVFEQMLSRRQLMLVNVNSITPIYYETPAKSIPCKDSAYEQYEVSAQIGIHFGDLSMHGVLV